MISRISMAVALFALGSASDAALATTPDRPNTCFGKVCTEMSVDLTEGGSKRRISTSFSADMAKEVIMITVPGSGRIEVVTSDAPDEVCESKSIHLIAINRRNAKATGCIKYPLGSAYATRSVEITYRGKNPEALDRLLEVIGPIWALESSPGATWQSGYSLRLGPSYRISQ